MRRGLLAYFFLYFCLTECLAQTLITYPVKNEGEDKIIVQAKEGDENVSVYCKVNSTNNTVTLWEVSGSTVNFNSTSGLGESPYEFLSVAKDKSTQANISFVPYFMTDHDRLELSCRPANESVVVETFLFGIPAAPKLDDTLSVYNTTEGEDFHLDLSNVTQFPPYNNPLSSTWWLNGTAINDSCIMVGDYNITVSSTWRALSGLEFRLTVSTDSGSDTKNFTLNVQYPPEFEMAFQNVVEYGIINGTVDFVAVSNINGNPHPTSSQWIGPKDQIIMFGGRFVFPAEGRLMINGIQSGDFGNYTFIADNGIGSFHVNQRLIKAVPPGEPLNVTILNVKDEAATITWNKPENLGTPNLKNYEVQLVPFVLQLSTNDESTSIEATNLIPGTWYNVSVIAVSEFYEKGGQPSEVVQFQTKKGVPRVDTDTNFWIDDGQIVILYSLKHTGGFDSNTVSIEVWCGLSSNFEPPTSHTGIASGENPIGGDLWYHCFSDCLDDNLDHTAKVEGVLIAGMSYRCVVIASNPIGEFQYNTMDIIAETGIPAIPIVSVVANPGSITISIHSQHPGVSSNNDSFHFTVLITNEANVIVFNMTYTGSSDRDITVDLPIGNYTVKVSSENKYGISDEFSTLAEISMEPSESPVTEEPTQLLPLYGIIAVAVGGLVIIFITFMIILLVVLCVRHSRKKESVTFYKSGYEMTIKRF